MVAFGLLDIPAQMQAFYTELRESEAGGGWREVGEKAGISGAYARMIAYGERPLTPDVASRWMGKVDFVETVRVPACPSCGGAHVLADCHGTPVAAVVALAPGESVRRPGKARKHKRYHRPCMDDATYAAWLIFKASYAPEDGNHE